MYGFGEQMVNNDGGDDDNVEHYHEHYHYKWEQCELAGMIALATWLRDGRC